LGFDVHLLSNLEVRGRKTISVGGFLVSGLCVVDVGLEVVVEFAEVDSELSSMIRGDVALRMHGEIGVVAFVGEERRNAGGVAQSIILGKLSKQEKGGPVVLLVVAIASEVLFECLVDTFGLAVAFQVVSGSEVEFHVEGFAQGGSGI
jgi:hypothetical protein